MGQYFRSCILGKDKKTVLQWLSSYTYDDGAKLTEHSYMLNGFVGAFENLLVGNPQNVVWAGDYAKKDKGMKTNVYGRCDETNEIMPLATVVKKKYIVNHDKKLFVDKSKVTADKFGWKYHPLPLLTAIGNGDGGGDFYGTDKQGLIGSWARDLISTEGRKPKGYTEIIFDLMENGK